MTIVLPPPPDFFEAASILAWRALFCGGEADFAMVAVS
jgi:hypothetical protein